ncbi:unannotated protein [freshwater metagenome]|uniref:Unannotated protein n=1 Tax=freshwater metagenome TaxID=449393 RepID=A0A6J7PUC6_9ZZZZ
MALSGVAGNAPPTNEPSRFRDHTIVKKRIAIVATSCGFLRSELHFAVEIGTNKSSSSFNSIEDGVGSASVGNNLSRIDSAILLRESLSWDQRGGI